MSKKNIIRLTESELKRVISESVKRVLKESDSNRIFPRTIQKWQKFNEDLNTFYQYSETDCIYEDPYTPRYVKNFNLNSDGVLTYEECVDPWGQGDFTKEEEVMHNDDEALDWLKDFKRWLNKAKKYYATNADTLDDMHNEKIGDVASNI